MLGAVSPSKRPTSDTLCSYPVDSKLRLWVIRVVLWVVILL